MEGGVLSELILSRSVCVCVCVCVRAGGGRKKENTQFSLFCDLQKRRDFVCLFLLLCGSESVRSLIRQLRSSFLQF